MVTGVIFYTLRLFVSSVKSQRKVAQKESAASLKETVQLCCVSLVALGKSIFYGEIESWY